MSEKMTTVRIPGSASGGYSSWGRIPRAEAVKAFRDYHEYQRRVAEEALAATDEQLLVEVHTGVHVRRNVEVLPA